VKRARLTNTARVLNSASIHLLRSMREVDDLSGLTPPRLSALSVLHFAGPQTLGRLAAIEGVTPATMSRLVDGLSALGLAERRPHPDSARMVVVTVTDHGSRLMTEAAERRIDVIVSALRELSETEQHELIAASSAFANLVERLRSGR
jgi:DNA-binding MarR family transcriptional regulator